MAMRIGPEMLSRKYRIEHSAQCDPSCRARERGLHWTTDPNTGEDVLIASHDTPKSGGYYGAWFQEFERSND